ncbi:MAG: SRPBCC domain-containing protein [Candidatus Acidiferrum sp.]
MADIIHEFFVKAAPERVFAMFATPDGLNHWWTKEASGEPCDGAEFRLYFGPEYAWKAKVTRCVPGKEFELEMTQAHEDWQNTRVGCKLTAEKQGATRVHFYHLGWPEANEHWRVSNYCWAMYLRIMRRHLEYGETVAYEKRLDA